LNGSSAERPNEIFREIFFLFTHHAMRLVRIAEMLDVASRVADMVYKDKKLVEIRYHSVD
jgi:hypothetical protein